MHIQKENRLKLLLIALLVVFLLAFYLFLGNGIWKNEGKGPEQAVPDSSRETTIAKESSFFVGTIESVSQNTIRVRGVEKGKESLVTKDLQLPSSEEKQITITGTITKETVIGIPFGEKKETFHFQKGDAVLLMVSEEKSDEFNFLKEDFYSVKSINSLFMGAPKKED